MLREHIDDLINETNEDGISSLKLNR